MTARAQKLRNYVGGTWQESTAVNDLPVTNPATQEILGHVPLSLAPEVDRAVQAAESAIPGWRRTPPTERVQYLFKLKGLLEDNLVQLARCITMECGKTLDESLGEVRRAIENVEVACGIPSLMQGSILEDIARGMDEAMIRQPVGVVAAISPFNFPARIPFWSLPYAIGCGNSDPAR
ncbi:MAG: aldehyde dehydrogenase family protein [Anaerolineales bacterium]